MKVQVSVVRYIGQSAGCYWNPHRQLSALVTGCIHATKFGLLQAPEPAVGGAAAPPAAAACRAPEPMTESNRQGKSVFRGTEYRQRSVRSGPATPTLPLPPPTVPQAPVSASLPWGHGPHTPARAPGAVQSLGGEP